MVLLQPRRFHPLKALWVLAVLALFFWYTSHRDSPPRLWRMEGSIFGSTYAIQIVDNKLNARRAKDVHEAVERLLQELDNECSTWKTDSPLSTFNSAQTTEPVDVPPRLAELTALSLQISRLSGGAFDVTFGRLFDAWGFGRQGPKKVPSPAVEAAAREACGYDKIEVIPPNRLRKKVPDLHMAFNAIVPGYAAEVVASHLSSNGFTNIYVEVGGEIVLRGRNARGGLWRIGIDSPDPENNPGEKLAAILELTDAAVATSGDYRNFLVAEDGQKYSHIFDPRIGRPAHTRVASVTVVTTNGAWADALATTLFVMGPEEGLAWLTSFPETEALFFVREENGTLRPIASPGFARRTGWKAPAPH